MCILLQYVVSPLFFATWLSVNVVVATSSSLCDFSYVNVSSIRLLESYWYSLVLSSAPRRLGSRILLLSSSRALWLHTSIGQGPWTHLVFLSLLTILFREYADCTGVKVEGLQKCQQNLRHLLSSARRTGLFSIFSCSLFSKVAHEKFGLGRGAHNQHSCRNVPVEKSRAPP